MPNLEKTLNAFLIHYAISGDSEIFSNYLAQVIGVDDKTQFHFNYQYSDDAPLRLSPPKINMDELQQLLEFFHVERKSHKIDDNIAIEQRVLFDEMMPKFQDYVRALQVTNPERFKQYQTASRPKLEKNSLSRIRQYTDKLKKELHNPDEEP